ncbi:hypothetical protein JCM12107_01040 [Corynebacterium simulans]
MLRTFAKEFDQFCPASENPLVIGISINFWARNDLEYAVYKVTVGNCGELSRDLKTREFRIDL